MATLIWQSANMAEWCECGEHYVLKEMMWPNFADCCDCATAEEYEEHMGAEALAEALAEMGWEK